MATTAEIIKTKKGVIVPSIDPKAFNAALEVLEALDDALAGVEAEARSIEVKDNASFIRAGELNTATKNSDKDVKAAMDPYDNLIKRVKEFTQTQKLIVTNHAEQIRGVLQPKLAEYTDRMEREAKAEQEREQKKKQAILEREADEKRAADEKAAAELKKRRVSEIREDLRNGKITKRQAEKMLREAGALEEAAKAAAAAEAEEDKAAAKDKAAKTTVESNIPSVPGMVKRVNRKFKVVKPQEVKLKYLVPDEVAIGRIVRDTERYTIAQAEAEVGGIKIEIEKTF